MIQIVVDDVSGSTFPVNVFVSDIYENNVLFLGQITGETQLPAEYYISPPSVFINSPQFRLFLEDDNNCDKSETNIC